MSQVNRRAFGLALAGSAGATLLGSHLGETPTEPPAGTLTDVPGIKVGHFTDEHRPTGCTVILSESEMSVGVDYDGSAPGDLLGVMLQPVSPIQKVHAILLAGAGPFGLAAVPGVTHYLEERRQGLDWGIPKVRIPIVIGAVIDDLSVGDAMIRPGAEAAYKACENATTSAVAEGTVGVGAGATVGKMLRSQALGGMKGGVGCASRKFEEVTIAAMVVTNSVGDIRDWRTGKILAGARRQDGRGFADIIQVLTNNLSKNQSQASLRVDDMALRSTTLAVVATNLDFDKTQLTKIAMMASTGAARTINPYHTTGDGDSTFAVSTNKLKINVPLSVVGALAAEIVAEAVVRSVKMAKSIDGWPSYGDYTVHLTDHP
jgi:L-aminopeptidase/D-esterase-like protein